MNDFVIGLIALGVSAVSAPGIMHMLARIKSQQTISEHIKEHAHKQGTPTMGGLIVLLGFIAGLLVEISTARENRSGLETLLVLIVGYAIIGFADDYIVPRYLAGKRGLGWLPKLAMQIGVALLASFSLGFDVVEHGLFVFLVLFWANAYNFSDGMDGLAGGLAMVLAVAFAVLMPWSVVPIVLIGAFLPFLFLNAPPARVFMGDVGSLPIGATFAWLTAQRIGLGEPEMALADYIGLMLPLIPLVGIMLVELVPVPLQILWVKLFKRRLFPFKTPVHHALQDRGWPETRIVALFVLAQIAMVFVTLALVVHA